MDKRKDLVKKLRIFKQNVSKEITINRMFFFGSFAKGTPRFWSDIDLVVISSKFRRKKTYKRARKLYDYWNLDYPVDFLCYTPEEFDKLKKQATVVREAVETGIEI